MRLFPCIVFCVSVCANVAAAPAPSEAMPQHILDACDERASPFGHYDRAIAHAADDLIAMGVFSEEEFHGVKIGFCGLRAAGGPVATISCARDIILLDSGYAARDQELVRNATLAHEMKHYLQHGEQKSKFGANYCSNDQYVTDKMWMEEEADAFSDDVGELFFTGRGVEIRNECPVAVSVYLEAERPITASDTAPEFTHVGPRSTLALPAFAASKFVSFYAQTTLSDGEKQIWGGPSMPDRRFIDGKAYGLKRTSLSNASRSSGPFQLSLSCQSEHDQPAN